jgi:hypothetical protein
MEPYQDQPSQAESHEEALNQAAMDSLLRRSLAAPFPALQSNFDRRLMRRVSRNSKLLDRYRWMLLVGYAIVSAGTSAVIMRGAGLHWIPIGGILTPLTLAAAAYAALQAKHATAKTELLS